MKTQLLIIASIGALLLMSCVPAGLAAPTADVAFIKTAAAQTVVANFTLTAESAAPAATQPPLDTPTLLPTNTLVAANPSATPTVHQGPTQIILCDEYSWDDTSVDVNIPDNTQMTPGQSFVKTWKIKNSGTCTWGAGYKIIYAGYSTQLSGQPEPLAVPVAPGQEIQITVDFIAPAQPGAYVSAWTLQNASGRSFFGSNVQGTFHAKPLIVKIVVK